LIKLTVCFIFGSSSALGGFLRALYLSDGETMNDLPEQPTETTTASERNGGGTAPIMIEAPEPACPLERLDELDRRIESLLTQRDEIHRGLQQLAEEREQLAQELRTRLATRLVPTKAPAGRQATASSTQPHAISKSVLHADQLIELVKAHPGCTAHDVAKRVKRTYGTVYEQLCRLDKASQLRRELGGGTKPARFYPI
jgi:regulator of replication initiation timing